MGQAEVQDEQIEGLGGQRGIGRKAVAHRVDRVAIVPERAGQAVCQDTVVFGDQDTHGLLLVLYVPAQCRLLPCRPRGFFLLSRAVRRRNGDESPGRLGFCLGATLATQGIRGKLWHTVFVQYNPMP